jgi:hypothetical protein
MTETNTYKTTIAGILDIVAGASSLIGALVLFVIGVIGSGAIGIAGAHDQEVLPFAILPIAFFLPLAVMCLLIGAIAIAGGVAALNRRRMWLAVIGSIAALFAFFPLGIPAIILTIIAEKEFKPG